MTDRITILDLTHQEQGALDVLVTQWRGKRSRNNLRTAFYDMKNFRPTAPGGKPPDR